MIQSTKGKLAANTVDDVFGQRLSHRSGEANTRNAAALEDVRFPPGNGLEALSGDRQGQHSVRINKQWRICFVWTIRARRTLS